MPESEDLSRYTAPPDNDPEEPTYSTEGILAYIKHWIPDQRLEWPLFLQVSAAHNNLQLL